MITDRHALQALRDVEQWWLTEGMNVIPEGCPYCIFQVREVLRQNNVFKQDLTVGRYYYYDGGHVGERKMTELSRDRLLHLSVGIVIGALLAVMGVGLGFAAGVWMGG